MWRAFAEALTADLALPIITDYTKLAKQSHACLLHSKHEQTAKHACMAILCLPKSCVIC